MKSVRSQWGKSRRKREKRKCVKRCGEKTSENVLGCDNIREKKTHTLNDREKKRERQGSMRK